MVHKRKANWNHFQTCVNFFSFVSKDEKYKGVPPPKRMTLKELQKATNGFAKGNILGDGTLGQVFLGELVDPASEDGVKIQVVVKKLFKNFFPGYKAYLV